MESLNDSKIQIANQRTLKEEEMINETVLRSLLLELRPRLSSGNVFLQTKRTLSKVEVSSFPSSVLISLVGIEWSGVVVLNGPPFFSFIPSRFRIDDNSVSFSVVFEPLDKLVGSSTTEVLNTKTSDNISNSICKNKIVTLSIPCRPKCRVCSYFVWEEACKFDRVLELPSTPLEEVIGEWFCHGHGDSKNIVLQSKDFFYDNLSTVIYLKNRDPGILLCKKCQAWLGTVDKRNMCRLWGCTVEWEGEDGFPCLKLPALPLESFLLAVKQAYLDDISPKPIFKLLLESHFSPEERNWLVIFIVNGDLKLLSPFSTERNSIGEEKDFTEQFGASNSEELSGKLELGWHALLSNLMPEKDVKEVLQYWENHCEELPFKVELDSKGIKKVLFKEEKSISEMKLWLNQVDVVSIKIAPLMFEAGLNYLKQFNELLPHNERHSDGFGISYLPL